MLCEIIGNLLFGLLKKNREHKLSLFHAVGEEKKCYVRKKRKKLKRIAKSKQIFLYIWVFQNRNRNASKSTMLF